MLWNYYESCDLVRRECWSPSATSQIRISPAMYLDSNMLKAINMIALQPSPHMPFDIRVVHRLPQRSIWGSSRSFGS